MMWNGIFHGQLYVGHNLRVVEILIAMTNLNKYINMKPRGDV